ncbi:YxcD family protein [Virgibacillus sp. 179-BFC.A HS]|uniref:YxcD family protein n=1 Tax=Tigheibacillus jepli TaxID=3035914 RepID=A0ABU5CII1_9BACI|nr:YxcD family protein [Virgibacillus sp. 179-BFC.A HS]MDY0406134.1 YxcD family protein [Virgibacillus sp. 179-BFC.A HS]
MARLTISEQDIINALCVYMARKKQIQPEEVEVQLMYDDDHGFSAEIYWANRSQIITDRTMIDALRMWLKEFLGEDPYTGIKLELDDEEGIIAFAG